ncbi:dTDP-4-dehydrorhamnose 3,5-epimerase [Sulfurospirillum sp. UCH001]|uniref:dTDP-4-dehydrorhamnose 3,5-epimerase n=1 Tax=Sulfurospirillum sp. UCH001 TaxID=1581011 RepID=UPI00082D7E30|nr:dTDP-4-dehydrorhamnose 3,5-epimerase [Sulfurospirillum sp. UCH001]
MKFVRTEICDLILCEPIIFSDKRGYFFESFNKENFENYLGKKINFCQDNESKSAFGVLRGLHFQKPPFAQSKLVRVVYGKVLDVVVDLREDSITFGKVLSFELNDENKKQLFIPRGLAHGFIVLSEEAIFSYKVDNYYAPQYEDGLIYNDDILGIDWKINSRDIKVSEKDKKNMTMRNIYKFKGELYD